MPVNIERYIRRDLASIVATRMKRAFKRYLASHTWLVISWLLNNLARTREFIPPGLFEFDSSLILVGELETSKRRTILGIDLTDSIESWLRESMGIKKYELVSNLEGVKNADSRRVLVVTYDWLISGNRWGKVFKEIRELANRAQELNLPIWVAPTDPFALEEVIPATILVAMCGGSTIMQANTADQGRKFGLVFPSGPHIWTLPPTQFMSFNSDVPWIAREPKVLLAVSSDPRRISLMNKISNSLSEVGWNINLSKLDLNWIDYTNFVKNSQVVITTCWMYQVHITGPRRLRTRIPATTVTHRVWEGFAAGAVVVTNSNAVFDSLGFVAGIHYVELWDENEPIENIVLPPEKDLMKIAKAGHELFAKLVLGKCRNNT